jgi:hypothetical protein
MEKLLLIFVFNAILSFSAFCGTLKGAWEMIPDKTTNERVLMIATQKYLSVAVYEQEHFVRTYGGPYEITEAGLTLLLEFDTKMTNKEQIGAKITYKYNRQDNEFTIENLAKTTWKRIDDSQSSPLAGLWQITERENPDGTMTEMK